MSPINPSAIVDAVMTDLVAYSGVTPSNTISYAEPTIIMPDACPLLAVWCENTEYQLLSGGVIAYERVHSISVAWYVVNAEQAETGGTGDPATVQALDATLESLVTRLETYSNGVPGLNGAQQVATLKSRALAPQEGVTWRGLIEITVEEAA